MLTRFIDLKGIGRRGLAITATDFCTETIVRCVETMLVTAAARRRASVSWDLIRRMARIGEADHVFFG